MAICRVFAVKSPVVYAAEYVSTDSHRCELWTLLLLSGALAGSSVSYLVLEENRLPLLD